MGIVKSIWFWILVVAISYGCRQSSFSSKQELIEYLNDPENGLIHQIESGGFQVEVKYHPIDLIALREYKSGQGTDFQLVRAEYEEQLYFKIRIKPIGGSESNPTYAVRQLQQLQQIGRLPIKVNNTISAIDVFSDPFISHGKEMHYLVVFDRNEVYNADNEKISLSVNLAQIAGQSYTFYYSLKDIQDFPLLKITEL